MGFRVERARKPRRVVFTGYGEVTRVEREGDTASKMFFRERSTCSGEGEKTYIKTKRFLGEGQQI